RIPSPIRSRTFVGFSQAGVHTRDSSIMGPGFPQPLAADVKLRSRSSGVLSTLPRSAEMPHGGHRVRVEPHLAAPAVARRTAAAGMWARLGTGQKHHTRHAGQLRPARDQFDRVEDAEAELHHVTPLRRKVSVKPTWARV